MNNAEHIMQEGITFTKAAADWVTSRYGRRLSDFIQWLDKEHKEPILTDEEHDYLASFIAPFRDNIGYICKQKDPDFDHMYFIGGHLVLDNGDFELPNFRKDAMYTGMELGREYTLEELGLD